VHHRFHRALISACPLASLKTFSDLLYLNASRYRFLMLEDLPPKLDVVSAHRRLMDLILARRAATALAEHKRHIALPARLLFHRLASSEKSRSIDLRGQQRRTRA
jgi:GntR family carbon starvation induced transcriptional regulator